jgi:hypothetical protein
MPKFTVTVPIKFEVEVLQAANAEDAAKAISQIVNFDRRWCWITFSDVEITSWRPKVEAVTGKHCITLNEIEFYSTVYAAEKIDTAATA